MAMKVQSMFVMSSKCSGSPRFFGTVCFGSTRFCRIVLSFPVLPFVVHNQ